MDRVNQAMQGTTDLDRILSAVLDVVLSIFACDRAWLVHPCDPLAATWRVVMEQTRPEFPGAFALGVDLPVTPDVARVFEAAKRSAAAVRFDPGSDHRVPPPLAERFTIQSMIVMVVSPKIGPPYLFGLHQCSHPRMWTPTEERLFREIGRRLADALTSVSIFRSLSDSARMLDEAQSVARLGSWDRDLVTGRVTLSRESCSFFGLPPEERVFDLAEWHARWQSFIHPEDRPRVLAAVAAALAGGPRYDVEFRIVNGSGEERVIHSQGDVSWDASGRPVRMFGTQQDITERKRAEAELRASEERFRTLMQFSFDVYWESDAQHRFTVQQFAEGLTDAPPTGSELGRTRWEVPYLEPDEETWRRHRATLDAHLPFRDFELARPGPGGGRRYVSVSGLPMFDASGRFLGYRGVGRHITERKRAEQRLLAQHSVARILAETAMVEEAVPRVLQAVCEDLVWDVGVLWRPDRTTGVLRCVDVWHRAAVAMPDFVAATRDTVFAPGDALPGQVWASRVPIAIPDAAKEAGMRRGPIAAREGLHGGVAFPILLAGEVLGVLEFFGRDVVDHGEDLLRTLGAIGSQIGQFIERKRAERDLYEAQANLAHVTRVTTLGELAASIAHEVNQPLAAMVADANASLNWLAKPNPDLDRVREVLSAIVADGHRAAEVIQRIRGLAKKSAGLEKLPVDVNELIRDVLPLVRGEVGRHGVSVRMELASGLPRVLGDRVQLHQVLINLMMNGIEAMASVDDRPRNLVLRSLAHPEAAEVLVMVEDTGVGIDPTTADRLFTAFFTSKPGGMGLGLSISRSIVEAHGGRVWAAANPTHGTTVHVALPAMR
jgi:PAS domain S-box-containing protein